MQENTPGYYKHSKLTCLSQFMWHYGLLYFAESVYTSAFAHYKFHSDNFYIYLHWTFHPTVQIYLAKNVCNRKRKTSTYIVKLNLFRYHEISTSQVWLLQWQDVLKVLGMSFQTVFTTRNFWNGCMFFWWTLFIWCK